MRVVVTGGGTGGHIYPALSIAGALVQAGAEILFVGSSHGPEGELVGKAGFDFRSVPSGPITGMNTRTVASGLKLVAGAVSARSVLCRWRPDVVVGTGGYTSAGVAVAQWTRRGPIVLHEQNSIPGRTNRIVSRMARRVCVTFEDSAAFFPAGKTVLTGLPVRPEVVRGTDRQSAARAFGLDPARFTVLVLGGSQGAMRLNQMALEAAPKLCAEGLQVLHQTGQRNYESVAAARPDVTGYVTLPYVDDMAAAYSAADLVVSRSGASTIAEVTVRGLPAVLIPYPHAQADHQTLNARSVARRGAAVALDEKDVDGGALTAIVLELVGDRPRLEAMASASLRLAKPDAAERVAQVVLEIASAA